MLGFPAGEKERGTDGGKREEKHRQGREAREHIGRVGREYSVDDEAQPQIYDRQPPRASTTSFHLVYSLFLLPLSLYIPPPISLPFLSPASSLAVGRAALSPFLHNDYYRT